MLQTVRGTRSNRLSGQAGGTVIQFMQTRSGQ